MNSTNLDDILTLMGKSLEELADEAGMTLEQAQSEVVRIEKKNQVSDLINLEGDIAKSAEFIALMSKIRLHAWGPEEQLLIGHIEKSGNINAKSKAGGVTILMLSSHNGYADLVNELLRNGADTSITNNKGKKAVDYVNNLLLKNKGLKNNGNFNKKLIEILGLLDPNNISIFKAIQVLSESKNEILVKFSNIIKETMDMNKIIKVGNAVQCAAQEGCEEELEALIGAGALLDLQNKSGETAIILAAKRGNLKTVKILLNNGADFDIKDNDGNSALDHARFGIDRDSLNTDFVLIYNMISDMQKIKKVKISSSFNDNDPEEIKRLLDYLNSNGLIEWKNLISFRMDIDAEMSRDHEEYPFRTLLMFAVCKGDIPLTEKVIKLGVNPYKKDPVGNNSFQLAKVIHQSNHSLSSEIYKILKTSPHYSPSKDIEYILDYIKSKDMTGWDKVIISNDYNIEIPDGDGRSLLFMAIEIKDMRLVKMILDYGVDVNHMKFHGKTPYLFAKKLQKDYHGREEDYGVIAEMIKHSTGFNGSWNLEVYTGN